MKRIILFFQFSLFAFGLNAQNGARLIPPPESEDYKLLKEQNAFSQGGPMIVFGRDSVPMPITPKVQPNPSPLASVLCNCMIPVDTSFQIVPFIGYTPPEYRNDDASTTQINLPFNFCFYGQTMNSCYINNNGNISFGAAYATFSANPFPDPNFIMIAPFWGDVDTRDAVSGLVYYKVTPSYMIIRWQTVGYYSFHSDLLNDFQLIITDGTDPILPSGNNVNFCYGDMEWTTGDASGGQGGFGGTAATVGVNRGNGVDYIQIGQFDQPGTTYDGPFGSPDQVSWLDNQTFYFDVCNNGSGNNLPPIINSAQVCDTITLCVGDTTIISANFLSPENGQNTAPSITGSVLGLTVTSNTTGNPGVITATLIANAANVGYNTIVLTGTDNGSPSASTSANVIVHIITAPNVNFSFTPPPPQPAGTTVTFTDNTAGATTWQWDFGDGFTSNLQNPIHTYVADSLFQVTLTVTVGSGCQGSITIPYLIETDVPVPPILAPNVVTPGTDGINDYLQFVNLDKYPNSRLYVYNRWGNLVYENGNYLNDWKPNVEDGVYYYVINGPYHEKALTGFFHVIWEK
jgi:gliding motility-associated-like protein